MGAASCHSAARAPGVELRVAGFGNFEFSISGCGLRVSGFGSMSRVSNFGGSSFGVPGFRFRAGFGSRVSGSMFRVSGVGGSGVGVADLGLPVWGVQVSGLGSRVSSFRFGGFRFRGLAREPRRVRGAGPCAR